VVKVIPGQTVLLDVTMILRDRASADGGTDHRAVELTELEDAGVSTP
jgi:hypothetical protein